MSGYGFAGHIGVALESSGGTPVAASEYMEALSESLTATRDRYDTKNIVGRYAEPDDSAGIKRIGGDMALPMHPVGPGLLLYAATGVQSNSVVASGFLHTHEFTMLTSDWDSSYPQPPLTVEMFRDVTSSQQYAGVNVGGLGLSLAPNQDLRLTATLIGTSEAGIAKTTPTFVNSPNEPFTFDTASISLGGAGSSIIEAIDVNIDHQLEGVPRLNNSNRIAVIRRNGPQMIRVSGTVSFEDITEYENFLNQTEQALLLNVTKADSFSMTVDLPRVVYTAFPLGMSGRDRQTVGFEGIARYHSGSASAIKISLTNTRSGY